MNESLPEGPPLHRRPLPSVPPPGSRPRPVSTPVGKPPSAPPRSESMEKWQPMRGSEDNKLKRGRPVIQVLDARPMSEVGFRGGGSGGSGTEGLSSSTDNGPDITQTTTRQSTQHRPDVSRRPPPPARPPSFRHSSVTENNQKNQETEVRDDSYLSKPLPPKPVSRTSRPKSMFSSLPSPLTFQQNTQQENLITDASTQIKGIDNDGFDSSSRHIESQQYYDKDEQNVPDLLTGDTEGMYKRDIDLLSDVPNELSRTAEPVEEPRRYKGVPVFPSGVVKSIPGNRGPPPPLPRKSPSVQNLSNIHGEATLRSLNNEDNETDDCDGFDGKGLGNNDNKDPTPMPRMARGPTIIRPGAKLSSSYTTEPVQSNEDTQNDHNSHHMKERKPETLNTEKKLPPGVVGGVRIFPFALPKSQSEPESLKDSDSRSSTTKPAPSVKPKPALVAKPALRPKPSIAPKPSKRPQSAMFPSHQPTQKEESPRVSESKEDTDIHPKAPWQNELNARLGLRKTVRDKKEVSHMEDKKEVVAVVKDQPKDEWDTDELNVETRKPGPLKATYRPTIIRAAAASTTTHKSNNDEDAVKPTQDSPPSRITNRFSTSCTDIRSAGADHDQKMWTGPSQTTDIESNNNYQSGSKDDSYQPSQGIEMRKKKGPTIIRPPSMGNLSRASEVEDEKPLTIQESWGSSSVEQESWGRKSVVQESWSSKSVVQKSWTSSSKERESSHERQSKRQSTQGPPQPRLLSPVSQRRRSSGFSEESPKSSSNPVEKKSTTGKAPPPRPASGPKRDPTRRHSASLNQPPQASSRRASTGSVTSPTTPSFPHGVALFDYTAQQADELSFKKGDTLELVHSDSAEWMFGRLGRNEGLFPVNFIHVVIPPPEKRLPQLQTEQNTAPQQKHITPTGPHCIAIHDYNSGESGDLVFCTDDVITLLERMGDEWLRGECQGRQGIFPITYVTIVQDLPPKALDTGSASQQEYHVEANVKTASQNAVGIATHDFPGQQDGDLPFRKGDRITILEQIDSDWLRGESNGMQGIFPATFVQIETVNHSDDGKPPPLPSSPPPTASPPKSVPTLAVVLYTFPGEADGDLPLTVGEEVEVIEKIDADWMKGRVDGREGLFPAAFVEIFT